MCLALQPDGKTIVVGDFFSYDQTAMNCIAGTTPSGYLDTSFNPGSGADDFIDCVALTTNNKVVIGGNFLSYNGSDCGGIALVKTNGQLDTSFNSAGGFNDTVLCMALQANGQILVGGNFTEYKGVAANYIARLNMDGSLDSSFNCQYGTDQRGSGHCVAAEWTDHHRW